MQKLKIDNAFFRFMGQLGDVILLNLIWLLCCLPVVTIGASNTAVFYVARKIAAGEDYWVFRDFFRSFRQNLKQGTVAWLILLPLGVLMLADLLIGFQTPGAAGNIYRGIGIAFCLLWLVVEGYVFPLLARYDYNLRQLFTNALFLSVTNIPATLTSVLLAIWLPLLMVFSPDVAVYLLPMWLLAGGAVPAVAVSALLSPTFQRLERNIQGDEM